MLKRIAITGPESTGKSGLAEALAKHYNTQAVPEFAREYINGLSEDYKEEDLLTIAQGQFNSEETFSNHATEYLFVDTEFLVLKIWSLYKYGKCDPWILDKFNNHRYDLYLLCNIDLPWQPDPQREHPDKRQYLFDWYKKELSLAEVNFEIVSGKGDQRTENAIKIMIDTFK